MPFLSEEISMRQAHFAVRLMNPAVLYQSMTGWYSGCVTGMPFRGDTVLQQFLT